MADIESRSESPLSDIGSDAFTEDKFQRSRSNSHNTDVSGISDGSATPSTSTPRNMDTRPVKRRRIGDYDQPTPRSLNIVVPGSPAGSISSDSSGDVPTSPSFANLATIHPLSTAYAAAQANPNDPESADYTQVTRCQWANCPEPEQGNMDNLVEHIIEAHIPPRQKKYFCEWETCARKAMPHTSAYSLKAHMRSHTKEKPFMCQVPECDRSFTRSDALAKHMRTVHETEALRPSDPVPRGHTGGIAQIDSKANGTSTTNGNTLRPKIKLTFKKKSSPGSGSSSSEPKVEGSMPPLPTMGTAIAAGVKSPKAAKLEPEEAQDEDLANAVDMDSVPFHLPVPPDYYPPEIYADMDEDARSLPPSQYFRLLRREIRWATEEGEKLEKQLAEFKAQTDDARGNPVTLTISKDEEISDAIRSREWSIVNDLLDRMTNAELQGAIQKQYRRNELNGAEPTATQEDLTTTQVLERLPDLAIWQKGPQQTITNRSIIPSGPGTSMGP